MMKNLSAAARERVLAKLTVEYSAQATLVRQRV